MARRLSGQVPIICPNDGYGTKGLPGDLCPDCGSKMIEDMGFVDEERQAVATQTGGEEDLNDPRALVGLDDEEFNPMDGKESLEKLQLEEYDAQDEPWE